MDKRIEKTKHMIKTTMLELMKKKPFNKITVKEICENAYTSRITFYTYYEDKYDLIEDIATDIKSEVLNYYELLQSRNNAANDLYQTIRRGHRDQSCKDKSPVSGEAILCFPCRWSMGIYR